ncbi:MAG TPA: kelch repeat-containing protein [Candidatus Limnocylindrales bacterium]|nr:kelch repeat-containing protein [Candidatus Limnocylindrales bacterium]
MRRSSLASSVIVVIVLGACSAAPTATEPSSAMAGSAATPPATSTPAPSPSATQAPEPEPEPLAWERLEADGPAAREDHTWTVDGAGEVAYLFGGRDGATVFDDTWAYDLADDTWTRLAPPVTPPARFGHEAVWVDDIGLVVVAGQADAQSFFSDLWAYDPAAGAWAELPATGAIPVPRYGTCAAIGPDGRLWISHGFTEEQTRFFDTRAYDFPSGSWTDETPADGERPVERCLHGCWWTDDGELALYAGQTTGVTALDDRWILREGAWSRVEGVAPPARNLYARGRVDGGTIVFGGQALDGSFLADLWLLADDAIDAEGLEPGADPPSGRAGAELVVDAARGRALLFGGRGADGAFDDLWILGGL